MPETNEYWEKEKILLMMLTVFYKHRLVASFDFSYKSFLTYPMYQEYTVQREIDRKRHSERESGG